MRKGNDSKGKDTSNGSGPNFEAQLWAAADKMRGHIGPSGPNSADSFRADLHPDFKADLVRVPKDLANPPVNMSDWGGENLRQDVRWKFGMPPANNAR